MVNSNKGSKYDNKHPKNLLSNHEKGQQIQSCWIKPRWEGKEVVSCFPLISFTFVQLSLDTSLCHTVNVKTAVSALSAQAIC